MTRLDDMNSDFEEPIAVPNPYYASYDPSKFAWLYIAIDLRDMGIAKIGLTTKETPEQRIAEGKTYNPFLTLFTTYELSRCTFGVSSKELNDIEGYIHRRSVFGRPIKHLYTRRRSEWFYIEPEHAESLVDWILAKRGFSVDGKRLYSLYEEPNNRHGINVEYMKRIKRIYRPNPIAFAEEAESAGLTFDQYRGYYEYLENFHSRPAEDKVYL